MKEKSLRFKVWQGHTLLTKGISSCAQALDAYQAALKCNPDSKEVANKVKALSRLIRSPASQSRPPQATANGSITTQQQYDSAQAGLVSVSSLIQRFEERCLLN